MNRHANGLISTPPRQRAARGGRLLLAALLASLGLGCPSSVPQEEALVSAAALYEGPRERAPLGTSNAVVVAVDLSFGLWTAKSYNGTRFASGTLTWEAQSLLSGSEPFPVVGQSASGQSYEPLQGAFYCLDSGHFEQFGRRYANGTGQRTLRFTECVENGVRFGGEETRHVVRNDEPNDVATHERVTMAAHTVEELAASWPGDIYDGVLEIRRHLATRELALRSAAFLVRALDGSGAVMLEDLVLHERAGRHGAERRMRGRFHHSHFGFVDFALVPLGDGRLALQLDGGAGTGVRVQLTTDSVIYELYEDADDIVDRSLVIPDGAVDDELTYNEAPTADAGPDRVLKRPGALLLDASASTDRNFDFLTYHWKVMAAPAADSVRGLDAQARVTEVELLDFGAYAFSLSVHDGQSSSAEDFLAVSVSSSPTAKPAGAAAPALLAPRPDTRVAAPLGAKLDYVASPRAPGRVTLGAPRAGR